MKLETGHGSKSCGATGSKPAWSRNQSKSQRPPKSGWTIPWDGEVRDELCIMNKTERQNEELPEGFWDLTRRLGSGWQKILR
ncbi:alkbh8 [Symbiodinium microadriaticum]|nr:alkbh8 [Symbiodinium microadriaticum]